MFLALFGINLYKGAVDPKIIEESLKVIFLLINNSHSSSTGNQDITN